MATPRKPKDKKEEARKPAAKAAPKPVAKTAERPASKVPAAAKAKPVAAPKRPPAAASKEKETASRSPAASSPSVGARRDKEKPPKAIVTESQEPEEVVPRVRPKPSDADRQWQLTIREMLVKRRDELQSVVQSNRAQMAGKTGDSADVADRASEGFEDELAAGLIAIEAAQLEDIDDAIARINDGSYGFCIDCDKPIPRKRLEILPFARRCIPCEATHERTRQTQAAYEEAEDVD